MTKLLEITINVTNIKTSTELHHLFADKLLFPEYYGCNWDAFWDCISTTSQSHMPDVVILQGIENLIKFLPADTENMRVCFDNYLSQNPEKKVYYSNRACPCCGYMTFQDYFPGSYEICPICFWEDDFIQFENPDYEGGANKTSLRIAQKNFYKFGACDLGMTKHVRKPSESDVKDPRWKPEES